MTFKPQESDRDFISIIPEDLKLFEATDIVKVFAYMEKEFHLSKSWHADFKKQLGMEPRSITEQEFFFRYATKHIDPALQRLLRRKDSVIFAAARYLIRDKIQEKKKEDQHLKNFYRSGNWRKK